MRPRRGSATLPRGRTGRTRSLRPRRRRRPPRCRGRRSATRRLPAGRRSAEIPSSCRRQKGMSLAASANTPSVGSVRGATVGASRGMKGSGIRPIRAASSRLRRQSSPTSSSRPPMPSARATPSVMPGPYIPSARSPPSARANAPPNRNVSPDADSDHDLPSHHANEDRAGGGVDVARGDEGARHAQPDGQGDPARDSALPSPAAATPAKKKVPEIRPIVVRDTSKSATSEPVIGPMFPAFQVAQAPSRKTHRRFRALTRAFCARAGRSARRAPRLAEPARQARPRVRRLGSATDRASRGRAGSPCRPPWSGGRR